MKARLKRFAGFTLVEVMIATGIGMVAILALSQAMMYSAMGLKTLAIHQDISTFKNLVSNIQSIMDNQNPALRHKCQTMIDQSSLDSFDPALRTPQAVTLTLMSDTSPEFQINSPIGTTGALQIASITLTANQAAYAGTTFINSAGKTAYPIHATLSVTVNNFAAANHQAFGARQETFIFPLNLTLVSSTGLAPWSVDSCMIQTPTTNQNAGWTNTADTNVCYPPIQVTTGNTVSCPVGYYIVQEAQVDVPIRRYTADCGCTGSCKNCVCVVGWSCSWSCDANGNYTSSDNCSSHGTCESTGGSCTLETTGTTPTLTVTCCKVPR